MTIPSTPPDRRERWRIVRMVPVAVALGAMVSGCAGAYKKVDEEEILPLFEQRYIAPLDHYLERYEKDPSRRALVSKVADEKSRRCTEVRQFYRAQDKDARTLVEVKRAYGLSCPEVVDWFAELVAVSEEATRKAHEQAKLELLEFLPSLQADNEPAVESPDGDAPQPDPAQVARTEPAEPMEPSDQPADAGMNECRTLFKIRNYKEALAACSSPANGGHAEAQFFMGQMYSTLGDEKGAVKWTRRSAEHGYAEAEFSLGSRSLTGLGVPVDVDQATLWLTKAADHGDAKAQGLLGSLYSDGRHMPPQPKEAVKWFRGGAERGDADSQFHLGTLYLAGEGVKRDPEQARKWLLEAAQQGHLRAQLKLATVYRQGLGVVPDLEKAYVWYSVAAQQGNALALREHTKVLGLLSQQQRANADRQVSEVQELLARR